VKRLPLLLLALALPLAVSKDARAQARGGTAGPASPRAVAPIDLTGQWVAVISEDWRWRMITPSKGDIVSIPLNLQGQHVAEAWDPAKDEAAGEQCRAYGAPGLMRGPIRMRISWLDSTTLKVETDYGMQTRLLRFANAGVQPGPRSWQGATTAEWIVRGGDRGSPRFGTLKTVTTNLRPGYLRKNGVPYSERATVTEHFDIAPLADGGRLLLVTTIVEDPVYLTGPYIVSPHFKKEPDGSKWDPTPCSSTW
jgi:hypothetical protein